MPLVVMLHGCRQTALSFAQGSRMNQWADAAGFMVLYPQQSMARQVQRCWRWFQPDALHGGGEADLIAALVRSEVGRHGLDPTRVYIAGLSAGAGMAALVALRHPQLVAALAMHSGPVTGDARAAAGLQTMRRARSSPCVRCWKAWPIRQRCAWACRPSSCRASSIPPWRRATRASCSTSSACSMACTPRMFRSSAYWGWARTNPYRRVDMLKDRRAVVRLCEITHVEHAWSGGDPAVRYHSRGGPDASALIWRFFQAQRRGTPPAL